MDPGTAIAIVQLTGKVISTVSKYYSDVTDARDDITAFLMELEDFESVVGSLKQSLPRDKSSLQAPELTRLQPHLEECLGEIQRLEQKLSPDTGGRLMRRVGIPALKWPFSKAEVEKRIEKLREFKGRINLALTMDLTYGSSLHSRF